MTDRFYEISGQWMKACGKGDQPKVVRVISASNNHPTMTALTVDMGDGHTWTVIAEWRGRFVEAPQPVVVTGDELDAAAAQVSLDFTHVEPGVYAAHGVAGSYRLDRKWCPRNGDVVTVYLNGNAKGPFIGFDEALDHCKDIEARAIAHREAIRIECELPVPYGC